MSFRYFEDIIVHHYPYVHAVRLNNNTFTGTLESVKRLERRSSKWKHCRTYVSGKVQLLLCRVACLLQVSRLCPPITILYLLEARHRCWLKSSDADCVSSSESLRISTRRRSSMLAVGCVSWSLANICFRTGISSRTLSFTSIAASDSYLHRNHNYRLGFSYNRIGNICS